MSADNGLALGAPAQSGCPSCCLSASIRGESAFIRVPAVFPYRSSTNSPGSVTKLVSVEVNTAVETSRG
jgi:hypothetical protein